MAYIRGDGIYRGIILAIAGLMLIGTSPSKQAHAQPQSAQNASTLAGKSAAANVAAPEWPVAPSRDQGCKPGRDDRKSDLCAQWKAADAASNAAQWAWWQLVAGVVGLLLGFITMAAAIAAAWFAKGARDETKRGADLANSSLEYTKVVTQRQIEAFVYIGSATYHDKPVEGIYDDKERGIVSFTLQNFGKTMAYDVSVTIDVLGPEFKANDGKLVLAEEKFGGEFYPAGRIREYRIEFPWPDDLKRNITRNFEHVEIEFVITYKLDSEETELFASHEGSMLACLNEDSDRADFVPPYKGWHTND